MARGSVSTVDGEGGKVGIRVGDSSWRRKRGAHALCMENCAEPDNASGKNAGISERFQGFKGFPGRAGLALQCEQRWGGGMELRAVPAGEGVLLCSGLGARWDCAEIQSKTPAPVSGFSYRC